MRHFSPSPNLLPTKTSNHLETLFPPQTFLRSFHQTDSPLLSFPSKIFLHPLHTLTSKFYSKDYHFSEKRFHLHLTDRTSLNSVMSLTPKPPQSLGLQTFSQLIQHIFFYLLTPTPKKVYLNALNLLNHTCILTLVTKTNFNYGFHLIEK